MSNHPSPSPKDSPSKYRSVIEGMELANQFASSGQRLSEFARQRGVSPRMVVYWSTRARQLDAATTTPALVPVAELGADGVLEAVRASSCEGWSMVGEGMVSSAFALSNTEVGSRVQLVLRNEFLAFNQPIPCIQRTAAHR